MTERQKAIEDFDTLVLRVIREAVGRIHPGSVPRGVGRTRIEQKVFQKDSFTTVSRIDHSLRRLKKTGKIRLAADGGGWLPVRPEQTTERVTVADVKNATVDPVEGSITIPVVEKLPAPTE